MTRLGLSMLAAGALAVIAGSAYAADPQAPQPGQQQLSYTSGAAPSALDTSNADHFVKPPGYDQNPAMYPYTRKGAGPKPN
jgi:hypothetical protein